MRNKGNVAEACLVAGRGRSLLLEGWGRALARHAARQRQTFTKLPGPG